jgi:hypothetical protein
MRITGYEAKLKNRIWPGMCMRQVPVFDRHDLLPSADKMGVPVEEIPLGLEEATFVGGRQQPIHRWYKLRPSFSPCLVRYLIERLGGARGRPTLDPFAGAGTTPVEACLLGRPAVAVEINPFLSAYMHRALDWSATPRQIQAAHREAGAQVRAAGAKARAGGLSCVQTEMGVEVPPIHNVFRWWRPDVLAQMLAAKAVLRRHEDPLVRRLVWLALGTVCIEAANIKRLHPTLTFYDRSAEEINVPALLLARLEQVAEDLTLVGGLPRPAARIVEGNSRALDQALGRRLLANVITSPPYCNRYSYVWETRPHLYMMDLLTEARRATALDVEAIGGTWGSATFSLRSGELKPNTALLGELLAPVLDALRPVDNLMANYAVKYFNTMDEHFAALGKVLRTGSRFAYVVGNSRLKGVDIPTERILSDLLRARPGFRVDYLLVFRRRIGRRALFESAIVGHVA